MDEFQEVPPPFDEAQVRQVQLSWKERWGSVIDAQNQILNWLFAFQGAGLAGTLTYASSKAATYGIQVALFGFTVGLVLIVVYGAVFYYIERREFITFRRDARAFFAREIDWTEYSSRDADRPDHYISCEILAWSSGAFGALGLISLGLTILSLSTQ